ncbi:MAG: thiamine phosphate synthase, partial [Plesiomonas shigelloides]
MPALSATHSFPAHHFAPCQSAPLGFYPVVDSLALLERLLALGVRTLQLRIKAPFSADVDAQIAAAVALGRRYQAQLFINDHWQAALQHGAYGVHLGQEDLALADLSALAAAGLRLGVSTHG